MRIGGISSAPLAAYAARKAYANQMPYIEPTSLRQTASTDTVSLSISDERGRTVVGGWMDRSNTVTVYRGDDAARGYRVKHWGADGRPVEYKVDPSSVDPEDANMIEMYVRSVDMVQSGALPDAKKRFMDARAAAEGSGLGALDRANWLNIVSDLMVARYGSGDMEGFGALKRYWDALSERALPVA